MQRLLHLSECDEASVLFVSVYIIGLKPLQQNLTKFLYFAIEQYSQQLLVRLGLRCIFAFVSFKEHLNRVNAEGSELVPSYFAVWIFICNS